MSLGKVIATQDPVLDRQGKVEIWSFGDGLAQVPAIERDKTSLLRYVLGNRGRELEAALVSPNFGVAENAYFKAVETMRIKKTRGCSYGDSKNTTHWHTDEDTVRPWIFKNPSFIEELVREGWMYFSEFKSLEGNDAKDEREELHLDGLDGWKRFIGTAPLGNLVRLMERPEGLPTYELQIRDLKELIGQIGPEAAAKTLYTYKVGGDGWSSFLFTKFEGKEGEFRLHLDEMRDFLQYYDQRSKPNTLKRTIRFTVPFGERDSIVTPDWWTRRHSDRVYDLAVEYAKQAEINYSLGLSEDESKKGQMAVSVKNRLEGDQELNPDTGKLIEQANNLWGFIKKAIHEEHAAHARVCRDTLSDRRKALGLPEPKKG